MFLGDNAGVLAALSPYGLYHPALLVARGPDAKSVQKIFGHVDASMPIRFYVKASSQQMRNAIEKCAAVFDL